MISKAVIPAAGMGTRFLPATKAQPKEMLPILDAPAIQYVVQEAVDSGIDDILIVTGRGKRAIEDHFDRNTELELLLLEKKEKELYKEICRVAGMAKIHFIRQQEVNGLGDAVYCARYYIGNEPFAVLLGDTVVDSEIPVTQQLINIYMKHRQTVLAVEEVAREEVVRFGIVSGRKTEGQVFRISDLVEKPSVEESPSNLAIVGRYILTPDVFTALERIPRGVNDEIQLTDALRYLAREATVLSYVIEGKRYDIGNKLDYLKTQVEFGLKRKEFGGAFLDYLRKLVNSEKDG